MEPTRGAGIAVARARIVISDNLLRPARSGPAAGEGTKAAAHYPLVVPAGGNVAIRLRLSDRSPGTWTAGPFSSDYERTWTARHTEADAFYRTVIPETLSPDAQSVMRQSLGGVL